jgi:pyruvate kinase
MLESMMTHPRPTRAEVTDVANAIYDGTDAVMLSGETAVGRFPLEAVRVMADVAAKADTALAAGSHQSVLQRGRRLDDRIVSGHTDAISHAVHDISQKMDVKRIVCFTMSGYTAAMIARHRPCTPITAITTSQETLRRCALVWGVEAVSGADVSSADEMMRAVDDTLLNLGLAERGDTVVIVAGMPFAEGGRTNLLKLHVVGEDVAG